MAVLLAIIGKDPGPPVIDHWRRGRRRSTPDEIMAAIRAGDGTGGSVLIT